MNILMNIISVLRVYAFSREIINGTCINRLQFMRNVREHLNTMFGQK